MSGKEQETAIPGAVAAVVLFADVSGSARLYEKLGDTEAVYAIDRCIKRMERSIESFRGRLAKSVGGELEAVFAAAEDACLAAIDMQQRVADLPPMSGVKLGIRIGFHCGPARFADADPRGEAVDVAARLTGLAKSGQVLCSSEAVAALPEPLQASVRPLERIVLKGRKAPLEVCEVQWDEDEALAGKASSPRGALRPPRLCVRHGGKVLLIDERKNRLTLGRDAGCDLVIADRRASRQHGRIECCGDKFVLTDASTNGTYVSFDGEQEFFLRHGELVLRGSGRIAFAASTGSDKADVAEFEHL